MEELSADEVRRLGDALNHFPALGGLSTGSDWVVSRQGCLDLGHGEGVEMTLSRELR